MGEITREQIDAAKPLDALIGKWSGKPNADSWRREAPWGDRWEEVRQSARKVLTMYPDEDRPSDWMKHKG